MTKIFIGMGVLLLTSTLHAQPKNIRVDTPPGNPEEVTIAINPANPQNLVAGANIRYVFSSKDGGMTWKQMQLPNSVWGDPSVIFDHTGRAYIGNLTRGWDAITVRYSDDGGETWSAGFKVRGPSSDSAKAGSFYNSSLQDKEWLIADHSGGPYRGNIYMAWTDFTKYGSSNPRDSSVIAFARSTNRGESFEPFIRISDKAGNAIDSDDTMEGAVPAVGPDSEVYVAWSGPDGLYFDRSLDGGQTFGKDLIITETPGGWNIDISGINRCNGMPVTVCDISTSPNRGTVYINWIDLRNGDPDVFVMKSTDRGETWSKPVRVNDDPVGNGKEQFFTWATIDQITGELCIVYYDRQRYNTDSTDVVLARSTDGGETFTHQIISEAAFLPTAMVFIGDYIGISAHNGRIRPIWTRLHDGQLSVYTALIDGTTDVSATYPLPSTSTLRAPYPNPVSSERTDRVTLRYDLSEETHLSLEIHDLMGRKVIDLMKTQHRAGNDETSFLPTGLRPGTYIIQMTAQGVKTRSHSVHRRMLTILR